MSNIDTATATPRIGHTRPPRTDAPAADARAHRALRASVVISALRCLVTYLLVPIATPLISFADLVAAPISLLLCLIAAITGVLSVRRFWKLDHRFKWLYTGFIAFVFLILTVAVITDIATLASTS